MQASSPDSTNGLGTELAPQARLEIPVPTPSPPPPPLLDVSNDNARDAADIDIIELARLAPVDDQVFHRKRPPCDWNPHFWRKLAKICNRYPLATTERPFPILSTQYDGQLRIRYRLANRMAASTRTVEFVDETWEHHVKRFGVLNPLQEEERKISDHTSYMLSHLPRAIACSDVPTKRKIGGLLRQHGRYIELLCDEECKARREAEIRVLYEARLNE